jgi:hypothetical protein
MFVICGLLGNYMASCGNNYHTMPCNYPKDHRLHQHRGRSLKSRSVYVCSSVMTIVLPLSTLHRGIYDVISVISTFIDVRFRCSFMYET